MFYLNIVEIQIKTMIDAEHTTRADMDVNGKTNEIITWQ